MKNYKHLLLLTLLFLTIGAAVADAQKKAADYKISKIRILPFDSQKGEFEAELKPGSDRSFFNDLAISLFVTVEISGEAGSFEEGRMIDIVVTEGKKQKAKKLEQIGLIGDGGKFYVPVWLDAAMCGDVKITARITGQKTASSATRTVPFVCGE